MDDAEQKLKLIANVGIGAFVLASIVMGMAFIHYRRMIKRIREIEEKWKR